HLDARPEELVDEPSVLGVSGEGADVGERGEAQRDVDVPRLRRIGVGGHARVHVEHARQTSKNGQRVLDDVGSPLRGGVLRVELQQLDALDHARLPPSGMCSVAAVMAWKRWTTPRTVRSSPNAVRLRIGGMTPASAWRAAPASTRKTRLRSAS